MLQCKVVVKLFAHELIRLSLAFSPQAELSGRLTLIYSVASAKLLHGSAWPGVEPTCF